MKEIRQSKEYANYLKTQGWIIEKINPTRAGKSDFVFIKPLSIFGSMIKYQRPEKPDLKKLLTLAKKYRAFYIVAELNKNSDNNLFLKNRFNIINPFLPSKTLILDLNKDVGALRATPLQNIFSKDARYSIRKAKQEKVFEEVDLIKFQKAWKSAASRGRYILSVSQLENFEKAFGDNMILLTNKDLTSGGMFLLTNNIGYYWYGFTSDKARATHVQYKIIYEGIKWAKKRGAKKFDFEGIYDERFPNKDWIGFTAFKKKFGGTELEYPPALGKWEIKNIIKF